MTWRGPFVVEDAVSRYEYTVRPFTTIPGRHRPRNVHIRLLRRFATNLQGTEAAAHEMADADFPDNEVQRIIGHIACPDTGELWLGVRWRGCGPAHDSRLPARQLYEDIPALVADYLRDNAAEFPECARALGELLT